MRDERLFLVANLFLAIVLGFTACQKDITKDNLSSSPQPTQTPQVVANPTPSIEPTPIYKSYSSIRKIDFKDFKYFYPALPEESFTLKNGKIEKTEEEDGAFLGKIEYGDVTNDRNEEALINIQPITGGNCQCVMVFIYTLENKKPKLLWSFDTDDRANGGFKKIYAEKGNLVVETFGDNKFENGEWEFSMPKDKPSGLCCPTAYTKIIFKWNGEMFIPFGERQVFDYDWKKNSGTN